MAASERPWVGVFQPERLQYLAHWVVERENVRRNREAGKPKPWTDDKILRSTRFCNVRRMDDKVSRWLLDYWYPSNVSNVSRGETLAAAALARLINWPDALDGLRGPKSQVFTKWDMEKARAHFEELKSRKQKVFTGAYIINAAGGGNKVDIVLRQVNTFYKHGELLRETSMQMTHEKLQTVPGIGSFIAGQMVADLRHVWPGPWIDRDRWAPLGPGSTRGMRWLQGWNGNPAELKRLTQIEFERLLKPLIEWFWWSGSPTRKVAEDRKLEAHDVQNCLCEYDKWMRLYYQTGRAKNKFEGV